MSSCFGKPVDGGGTCSVSNTFVGVFNMSFRSFGGVAEERRGIINEPNCLTQHIYIYIIHIESVCALLLSPALSLILMLPVCHSNPHAPELLLASVISRVSALGVDISNGGGRTRVLGTGFNGSTFKRSCKHNRGHRKAHLLCTQQTTIVSFKVII